MTNELIIRLNNVGKKVRTMSTKELGCRVKKTFTPVGLFIFHLKPLSQILERLVYNSFRTKIELIFLMHLGLFRINEML